MKPVKRYTVSQLAALSGVSVRTLHHYDTLGLLVPATVGANGYRYYGERELLQLQQILLHREFGIPLKEIGALLAQAERDRVGQLRAQRARLAAQAVRYQQLMATLDRTIAALTDTGEPDMASQQLYQGFSAEQQATYETEIAGRYGQASIDASRARQAELGAAGQASAMAELAHIEGAIADSLRAGVAADDASLAPWIARHRAWVASMWRRPCPPEAYAGLADLYQATPDFVARYEQLAPGLSDYLSDAMKAHATA
ncbi:MerR family transcriptional regulator [Massilia sp. TS11]|uniref:MerR family transcriptional regulator n=1 Tax=Massilia sp. TS11 TaxID=2908003 RepID=UPI001EDB2B24|nr:MerR family transcriptional regulator [Massilia sp. TS11]MCG2582851.1 MerR family transcriptional regulator [Massilia sp. TS11]